MRLVSASASVLQEPQEVTCQDFPCPSVTFLPRIPSRKYHDLLSRLRDPREILLLLIHLLFETASPYSPGWSELAVRLLSLWVAGTPGVCRQVWPSVNPQLRLGLMNLFIKRSTVSVDSYLLPVPGELRSPASQVIPNKPALLEVMLFVPRESCVNQQNLT